MLFWVAYVKKKTYVFRFISINAILSLNRLNVNWALSKEAEAFFFFAECRDIKYIEKRDGLCLRLLCIVCGATVIGKR